MVNTCHLDCAQMTSRDTLHAYLKKQLSLPEYYGGNLDALFDCLTELSQPLQLELSNLDQLLSLGSYGKALVATFRDAALENPNLELLFSDN